MNAPQKIAGFVFGLAVVFAAAFGVGVILGPGQEPAATVPTAEPGHGQGH